MKKWKEKKRNKNAIFIKKNKAACRITQAIVLQFAVVEVVFG